MSKKTLNREERRQMLTRYAEENVKPVFDRLITELLASMPDDLITWSVNWLNDKGRRILRQPIAPTLQKQASHSDEDDEVDDLPHSAEQPTFKKQSVRVAVSAEVYGQYNKKEDFVPRVIPKNPEQEARIVDKLSKSFMFSALDQKEQKIVINAMEEKTFKPGDWVIRQGDDGDELYVIDQGQLDCTKIFKKDEQPTFLKTYQPGESFGELALLYNAPRAASVQATTEAVCFALDRATFNNIVKDAAVKKREKFEHILSTIDLLKSMDPYERTHLGDGAKEEKHKAGDVIIKQGDEGEGFYMISEGELLATQVKEGSSQAIEVYHYKPGDYFGELALIKNVPRQATVTAKTDVHLVYLDQDSFRRLMGPIEDILKRNMDRYEKYVQQ